MPDLTIEKAQLFLLLVLPGFVAIKVYDLFVPPEKRDFASSLIDAICYSLINLAIWCWAVVPLNTQKVFETHPVLYALASTWLLVIAPALMSLGLYFLRLHWSEVCCWLKAKWAAGWIEHPTTTAWNHFFHRRPPCFVLCHLKSGGRIGGVYHQGSYVAAYPQKPEIYLSQVWDVDEKGRFLNPVENTLGVIVRYEDCELLEFFKLEEQSCLKENERTMEGSHMSKR
jgi:hypothetical protein